jgi:hypothetical protein
MRTSIKAFVILLSAVGVISCKHDPPLQGAANPVTIGGQKALVEVPPPTDELAEDEVVARTSYVDSMMHLEVTLPPILDESAYDTATVNSFERLAASTREEMKLLASADLLEKNITSILCTNSADNADILFLVDNTGSMEDDIAEVKKGMDEIIDALKEKKRVRLAIATYRDKQYDSTNWFSFREFETDYKAAKAFTDSMKLVPNDDLPESIYEAFIEASKHKFWQSRTKRIVLIIGDARGKEKADGGMYDLEDMIKKAGESRIKVNFFPLIVTPYSEKYRSHDLNPQPATETHIIDQVFPNPTCGTINIKMLHEGRYRIAVYTMTGLMVEDQYIDDDTWMIDMRIHTDGLYVIRVTDKNNQYEARKFVLQR